MKKFIGCDLGGTNLHVALVDVENAAILAQRTVPTLAREGHDAVVARMISAISEIISESGLTKDLIGGIGIGLPGVLDLEKGETLFLPNLPGTWPHVPVKALISEAIGLPVSILNDARAITYGEWRFGLGKGTETMALFAIGTGVGGGLVINGQLHLGMGGTGGEIGHTTIDMNGPECGCGNRGCLEAFASAPAISAMGIKAIVQGLTTNLGTLCDYDLNRINPALIAEAARDGDRIAKDIYDLVGTYIGVAAANICVALGPKRIVISGGVSKAGDLLLEPIRRTLLERVSVMPIANTEVLISTLGENAAVLGAASWAKDQLI